MTLHALRHLLASWNAWRADRRLARVDPELYAAKVSIARQRRQHRSTRAAEAQLREMVTERLARGIAR